MSKKLRVLILEDRPIDAELVLREVRRAGYELEWKRVETEPDYVAQLDQGWEIILADYNLPQFTGMRALELLNERGLDIPFVIVSSTVGEDKAVAAMKAGASDYVMKDKLARLGPAVVREVRDATERRVRKRAEAALRESEERYRDIFDHAPIGIYHSGLDGTILTANGQLAAILGYESVAALRQASMTRDVYASADERDRLITQHPSTVDLRDVEVQWRRMDGTPIWIQLTARAIKDPHGRTRYFEGFVRDVSGQKQTEEQLRQSQKMEAIARLAGGVAHDFNNLLTGINAFASLLADRFATDDAARADVAEIVKAVSSGADLTRQLLAFGRRQVLQPRVFDPNALVAGVRNMLDRIIGEDITLVTELAADAGRINADPGQLEQVVLNLAVNARDAMPTGGTLTIRTRHVHIAGGDAAAASPPAGDWVRIAVTDTGVGMDAATRERVFEPFYTTKESGKGTGLGLSSVYGVVQQSKGHITVESEPGRGATFSILLPRVLEPLSPPPPRVSASATRHGTETILLVEDQVVVRRGLRHALERYGYRVLDAGTADDALSIAAAYQAPIHLLITDVVMPGRTGFALAKELRHSGLELATLYVSGYAAEALPEHEQALREAAFLAKPFSMDELALKVREVLETAHRGHTG